MRISVLGVLLGAGALAASSCTGAQETGNAGAARQDMRILAISVNESEKKDFERQFLAARKAGLQAMVLSFDWCDLETAPGKYEPKPDFLEIANVYYGRTRKIPVHLMIRPLHTNQDVRPAYLKKKSLDDREVMVRFCRLLDFVFARMPDTEIPTISIGSEADVILGADAKKWSAYERFYRVAANYARGKRPGIEVAAEVTFAGLSGPGRKHILELNRLSDVIGFSYYPLDTDGCVKPMKDVRKDLETVSSLFRSTRKPIYYYQIGCPSSKLTRSSEKIQAEFVREVFGHWDRHCGQVLMMNFTWMNDASDDAVKSFEEYYGYSSPRFAAFLGSLGLRTHAGHGRDKAAWKELVRQAEARFRSGVLAK